MDNDLYNLSNSLIDIGNYIYYEKDKIGKGSFSTIYKGSRKFMKEKIAIKKIDVENILSLHKNIKREIELHKKFKHRNIIKLYDTIFDYKKNTIYIIIELCSKGDFYTFQNKRPIKEVYIKKYISDLSEGLKYLYDKNIIHRDLKTKNLLISDCGDIKIADFGFAKQWKNQDLKNTYCGSPLYMAPEILYYQKYDINSDLWSVGIIIYEMITGNPPFHVKNFYQLTKKMKEQTIKIPLEYKISKELNNLLDNLLVKKPKNRISWDDFFNHYWFENKIDYENDLITIPIGGSLPNLDDIKKKNLYKKNIFFEQEKEEELTFNLLFENSDDEYISANSDIDDDDFDEDIKPTFSTELNIDKKYGSHIKNSLELKIEIKQAIKQNDDFIKRNYLTNSLSNSVMNNSVLKDYYIIKKDNVNKIIIKNKEKKYQKFINNSFNILKDSYDYLASNNKSI